MPILGMTQHSMPDMRMASSQGWANFKQLRAVRMVTALSQPWHSCNWQGRPVGGVHLHVTARAAPLTAARRLIRRTW